MDKKEELFAYFETEINEVSEKEIKALEDEIEEIRTRTLQELETAAKADADTLYEQEMKEMKADHAIALSHLNDENNRRLMIERDRLVDQVFAEAKDAIVAYTKEKEYVETLKKKLSLLKEKAYPSADLYVGTNDESLLAELKSAYANPCTAAIDPQIVLGGFRLVCAKTGVIIDETYDTALKEARKWFHDISGLTIR